MIPNIDFTNITGAVTLGRDIVTLLTQAYNDSGARELFAKTGKVKVSLAINDKYTLRCELIDNKRNSVPVRVIVDEPTGDGAE